MSAIPVPGVTFDEYLTLERQAEHKHQLVDGEIFAMSGVKWHHELVANAFNAALIFALQGRPCHVLKSEVRVKCADGLGTYPDIYAFCGEPEFYDDREDVILNPQVVAEVLSPSTEQFDRGRKFQSYQTIPSLREYVLLAQDDAIVEVFRRDHEDRWSYELIRGRDRSLHLATFEIDIPLGTIYAEVQPPTEIPPPENPIQAS